MTTRADQRRETKFCRQWIAAEMHGMDGEELSREIRKLSDLDLRLQGFLSYQKNPTKKDRVKCDVLMAEFRKLLPSPPPPLSLTAPQGTTRTRKGERGKSEERKVINEIKERNEKWLEKQKKNREDKKEQKDQKDQKMDADASKPLLEKACQECPQILQMREERAKEQERNRLLLEQRDHETVSQMRQRLEGGIEAKAGRQLGEGENAKTKRRSKKTKTKSLFAVADLSSFASSSSPLPAPSLIRRRDNNANVEGKGRKKGLEVEQVQLGTQTFYCVQQEPFPIWAGLLQGVIKDHTLEKKYETLLLRGCKVVQGSRGKSGRSGRSPVGIKRLQFVLARDLYELALKGSDVRPVGKMYNLARRELPMWFSKMFPTASPATFQSGCVVLFSRVFSHSQINSLDGILCSSSHSYRDLMT